MAETSEPSNKREWLYVDCNSQQKGPIGDAELARLAKEGTIRRDTLLWTAGMEFWMPAVTVNGLFPKLSAEQAAKGPPTPPQGVGDQTPEVMTTSRFGASVAIGGMMSIAAALGGVAAGMIVLHLMGRP